MKKLVLRLVIIVVLVGVGLQASLWLIAYQGMEKFKQAYGQSLSVDYDFGIGTLDGRLVYDNVRFTSFILKRSGTVKSVSIDFDSPSDLFSAVLGEEGRLLSSVTKIELSGGVIEHKGRSLIEWIETEKHENALDLFDLYGACGQESGLGKDSLATMGVDALEFDVSVAQAEGEPSKPSIELVADFKALGSWALETDVTLEQVLESAGIDSLAIGAVSLHYNDQGFFRRLSNYCESKSGIGRSDFAALAGQSWQTALADRGFVVNDSLVAFYRTFLALGGKASVSLRRAAPQTLSEWVEFDQNLLSPEGASLKLNGQAISEPQLIVESAVFSPAEALAPQQSEVAEERESARVISYPTNITSPSELVEPESDEVDEFETMLGSNISVELLDGKVHEGQLIRVDEYNIELEQPVTGGKLSYSFSREEIKKVILSE